MTLGVCLLLAVAAGLAALVVAVVVHPDQARANQRQLNQLRAYAAELAPRFRAIGTTTAEHDCVGDGLVGCEQLQLPVADATVKVAAAIQAVTGRAAEIQCFPGECALIVRYSGHILDVDVRPHEVSRAGADGTTTLASSVS
jgi:hypothetical protein